MSQADTILEALLRGDRLTKLDAFKLGAGLSLNSRVADLRRQGYVIRCECERRGGRNVWVYWLDPKAPKGQVELFSLASRERCA